MDRKLADVLGSDAIAAATISKSVRSAGFEVKGAGSDEGPGDPGTSLTDGQILHALEISPFPSARQIARMSLLPKTAVSERFTELFNFLNKKLRWAPQSLSEQQKRMRVEQSNDWFQTLISMKYHPWRHIATLDESWFCLSIDHESISLSSGDTAPERESKMINSPKMMFAIVWNHHGFHLIDVLPK
jgi:hypothetical protein